MTKLPIPTPVNVRLTISVTPEVHEGFQRLAKAASMSISRAMGEWLGDTLEVVEYTAQKMEQARAAPKLVMREMHAYALGVADETGELLQRMLKEGQQARRTVPAQRGPGVVPVALPDVSSRRGGSPPVGNTGGKGRAPKEPKTRGRT